MILLTDIPDTPAMSPPEPQHLRKPQPVDEPLVDFGLRKVRVDRQVAAHVRASP